MDNLTRQPTLYQVLYSDADCYSVEEDQTSAEHILYVAIIDQCNSSLYNVWTMKACQLQAIPVKGYKLTLNISAMLRYPSEGTK